MTKLEIADVDRRSLESMPHPGELPWLVGKGYADGHDRGSELPTMIAGGFQEIAQHFVLTITDRSGHLLEAAVELVEASQDLGPVRQQHIHPRDGVAGGDTGQVPEAARRQTPRLFIVHDHLDESAGEELGKVAHGGDGGIVLGGGHHHRPRPERGNELVDRGEVLVLGAIGDNHPRRSPEEAGRRRCRP